MLEKPPRLAVHPTLNYPLGTLANGYAAWAAQRGNSPVFRPVNRIDKDTSGLVLAAQNGYAAPLLAGRVEKLYYAVVEGELPLGPGVIDAPIGRQGGSIIGRCVTPDGKPSRTEYTILKAENGLSLAACVPVTGRTHQIRVHFASIGHPLAGDDLYGGSRARIGRQALHCARQTFRVPRCETLEDGIRAVQQLLADGIRPDGILCGEDLTAAGVLKALLRAGIRVPEETAVVGYDNSTYARLCEPELTSVDNKPEQVALLCVQLLQSRIEHGEDYSSVTLQPELVQRQSS